MSLSDGTYTITSGNHAIGRYFIEDLSLLPKRVMTLPTHGHGRPTPAWVIHAVGDGKYKIKTGGSYVGVLPNGNVMAFLLEDMLQGSEWTIEHVPQHGEDAYIIKHGSDSERVWAAQDTDNTQVSVRHVICTRTYPPMYPSDMVFKFTPA